jgi:tetratricopeptide (TPR) repeat protein
MTNETSTRGKVIALHPFRRAQSFDQHFELGRMYREQGRLEDAARELQRAAALDRTHVDVRLDLGVLLAEQGQLHQATLMFEQVIELDPGNTEAHFYLGLAYFQREEMKEAVRVWQNAIKLDPEDWELRLSLAEAYIELSQHKKALKQLDKILESAWGALPAFRRSTPRARRAAGLCSSGP